MTSEINTRASEIKAAAASAGCRTIRDLAKLLGWPIQSASAANDQLQLGLEWIETRAAPVRQAGRANPKPVKKAKA